MVLESLRRLIKVLETNFLWQARKIEYFPKMVLESL